MREACGLLLAVVGASGVGKDTLLEGASRALTRDARFTFARRVVTRPAAAGGEHHLPVDAERFAMLRDAGGFALSWNAHGISYGIPAALREIVATGRVVVANLSRTVLRDAPAALGPTVVIEVTAPPLVLRERLLARGREDEADIAARLARRVVLPAGIRRIEFVNDAPLEQAVADFASLLRRVAAEFEPADE